MTAGEHVVVRDARPEDVAGICGFGEAHVRPHYAPLIGAEAADAQVRLWWSEEQVAAAVGAGLVVVAVSEEGIVGVAQRGRDGADHVVYKLYVAPRLRGRGVGPQLVDALVRQLPAGIDRLYVEHVAANERAAAFYEREGFVVERVDAGTTGDPARAVVWRARDLRGPGAG